MREIVSAAGVGAVRLADGRDSSLYVPTAPDRRFKVRREPHALRHTPTGIAARSARASHCLIRLSSVAPFLVLAAGEDLDAVGAYGVKLVGV